MATFALSPDGSVVYRVTPLGSVAASTLNSSLLTAFGYTVTTESAGTITVNPYEAGFRSGDGVGGGHFEAIYSHGSALAAGQRLEWVQVVTTNDPTRGRSTTGYLDNIDTSGQNINPGASAQPFYALTAYNSAHGPQILSAQSIYFYDYSARPPSDLAAHNPITWAASLYPVIVQNNKITVENGESWGWTAKNALTGTDTGIFVNASAGATTTGLNTSNFKWGSGSDPSSLSFTPAPFDGKPGVSFKVGTITYHNGTTFGGEATSVDLRDSFNFTNIPEKNFVFTTPISINTTVNTTDPIASADQVRFSNNGPQFNVQEGVTASADLFMTLSTGLTLVAGTGFDSAFNSSPFATSPNFNVTSVGLGNASSGGLIAIIGDAGDNSLMGTSADDTMLGLEGNDTISGGAGSDIIDGGPGSDTVVFSAARSSYTLTALSGNGILVSGPDGTDTLSNIEKLAFADRTLGWPLQPRWLASVDVGSHPFGWLPSGTGDYNKDGTSDLLWYNGANRDVEVWKLVNGTWAGSVDIGSHPAGWAPAGTGDFNRDGTSDVLWYNGTNGDAEVWHTLNGAWNGSVDIGLHPLGWQPAGVGDFNRDGTSDVLWFNPTTGNAEIWMTDNGRWLASVNLGQHPLGWRPVDTGDFNHDGTSDVLWYNPTNGDAEIWKISNGQWAGSVDIGLHPLGWQPIGTGDFNQDGSSDVAWFNAATGHIEVWLVANGQWAGSFDLGSHPAGWVPGGIGDFNHDGNSDILWRDTATNRIETWLLTS